MSCRTAVVVPTIHPTPEVAQKLIDLAHRTAGLADWVVVVDAADAPTGWQQTLRDAGFKVLILGANKGIGAARNAGIEAADCEFVLPLDDDDDFEPRLITEGLKIFDESDPQLAYVYSWARLTGAEIGIVQCPEWDLVRLLKENLCSSCALIRRDAWVAVGGYEELRSDLEDWDLWLKFAEAGFRGKVIEEPLFTYHRRDDSTLSGLRASGEIWNLRRQLIERHRSLYEAHMADVMVELAKDAYGNPGGRLMQLYRYLRIRTAMLLGRRNNG